MTETVKQYQTLDEFYPYYLGEHSNRTCRRLHFVGSSLGALTVFYGLFTWNLWFVPLGFVIGYGFAWVGHFFFEHNKPATFQYPWLSYKGDWKMWWQIATGKIPF
jgi:hypothetical protein